MTGADFWGLTWCFRGQHMKNSKTRCIYIVVFFFFKSWDMSSLFTWRRPKSCCVTIATLVLFQFWHSRFPSGVKIFFMVTGSDWGQVYTYHVTMLILYFHSPVDPHIFKAVRWFQVGSGLNCNIFPLRFRVHWIIIIFFRMSVLNSAFVYSDLSCIPCGKQTNKTKTKHNNKHPISMSDWT